MKKLAQESIRASFFIKSPLDKFPAQIPGECGRGHQGHKDRKKNLAPLGLQIARSSRKVMPVLCSRNETRLSAAPVTVRRTTPGVLLFHITEAQAAK